MRIKTIILACLQCLFVTARLWAKKPGYLDNPQRVRVVLMPLLLCSSFVVLAAELKSVTINAARDKTILSCLLSEKSVFHAFALKQPDRLVIDLIKTNTRVNPQRLPLAQSVVAKVRVGHPNANTLRLVLDTLQPVSFRSYYIPSANGGQLLRFELVKQNSARAPVNLKQTTKPMVLIKPKPLPTKPMSVAFKSPHANPMRDVVVVIDPGHGGKDPGARGPGHTLEKNVVLAIARRLKQRIDSQPGMRAVLTRNGDYYIELRDRMRIARKYNADIFVSIHADAFINHHSNGASVFALSPMGATSEAARWLAEKENYSELGGVDLSELDDKNGLIRTVLIDLSQTATIGSSLQMGNRVLHQLNGITNLHTGRVEQARFMVLKSPDIPSILVETGFISNPREERNLVSPRYQLQLTQAIFGGIKQYFWSYPPHGTRVEALSGVNRRLAQS